MFSLAGHNLWLSSSHMQTQSINTLADALSFITHDSFGQTDESDGIRVTRY